MNKNAKIISAFSICDDVLTYANWVIMLLVVKKNILKEFHLGDPGMSWMKSLMQSYTYWPGMDDDIERVVKTCRGGALAANVTPTRYKPWPKWTFPGLDYIETMLDL